MNPRSLGPKPSAIPNFAKPGYEIESEKGVPAVVVKQALTLKMGNAARGKVLEPQGKIAGRANWSSTLSKTPKPGAIPTSLYPDIQFLPLYHGGEVNQRFFCLWSFMWSKLLLCRFRQSEKIPQTQALQGFPAFHITLSRIQPRHSQSRRATSYATPGYVIFGGGKKMT